MNCMAFPFYVTLMAKCMCARLHHPLKLLPSVLLSCTNLSQLRWFHPCSWSVICQHRWCYLVSTTIDWKDDRLEDRKIISSCTNLW